jgi:diguanylate cyclase (GGDEF)-like protein
LNAEAERLEHPEHPAPISASALEQLEFDSSEGIRRNVLLGATGIATALSLVFWVLGASKDVDSIQRAVVPLLTLLFGVLTFLTWRGQLRGAEIGLLVIGGGVLLERIHFARNLPHPGLMPVLDAYELLIWFPSVYLFAFLLFDKKHALLFSLGLLAGSAVVLRDWFIPGAADIFHADLSEFYLGQLGCIFFVYSVSILRERLSRTHELAVDLHRFSETDFLTGVPNRRALTRTLEREITRCQRHGDALGLILLDVDRFKQINDSLGHDEGDRVLRRIALLVDRTRRDSDVFGRWGGEEFLLIAPSLGLDEAHSAAERLRQVLEVADSEVSAPVTASFGVSDYRFGDGVASMLKRADEALMKAKASGRNCVISRVS